MVKSILITGPDEFIVTFRFPILKYLQLNHIPGETFTANVIGGFPTGTLWNFSEEKNLMPPEWQIFLSIGLCNLMTFLFLLSDSFTSLQGKKLQHLYSGFGFFSDIPEVIFTGRILPAKALLQQKK